MKEALEKASESMREAAENLPTDEFRPQFHFRPQANWMNDPNGTIFYKGIYHVFYQLNPYGDIWGHIHWGHAKSIDLVHWEHMPIALAPSKERGENHCFSGCCVINKGTPTIFYTKIGNLKDVVTGAEQWAAISTDDMLTWEKPDWNPALSPDLHRKGKIHEWRDPYVWKEENTWYMVAVGKLKIHHSYGRVLLYKSEDLQNWQFVKTLIRGKWNFSNFRGWECPNFFKLGDRHILMVSPYGPVIYNNGIYENEEFIPGLWYKIDLSNNYYATNTYLDDKNRTILVGWVKAEGRGGWKGCLSLPRLLQLDNQNQLHQQFIPELRKIRGAKKTLKIKTLTEYSNRVAPIEIPENMFEIKFSCSWPKQMRYRRTHPPEIGIKIGDKHRSSNIYYNPKSHSIRIGLKSYKLQFPLGNPKISMHIYLDKSIVEIIVNSREAITEKIYPSRITDDEVASFEVSPFVSGMEAKNIQIDVWKIPSIW